MNLLICCWYLYCRELGAMCVLGAVLCAAAADFAEFVNLRAYRNVSQCV